MATPTSLSSATSSPPTAGAFQDLLGNVLQNGYITFDLSQAASVSGGGEVVPRRVKITLDVNGKVSSGQSIYRTTDLTPSGLTYRMQVFDSGGNFAGDFGNQSLVGGPPIDLSLLTPVLSSGTIISFPGVVLLNPNGSALQTISGPLAATGFFAGDGTAAAPSYSFTNHTNYGFYWDAANGSFATSIAGTEKHFFGATGLFIPNTSVFAWPSGGLGTVLDTGLSRLSANFVVVGNGAAGDSSASFGANAGFFTAGTRIANTGVYQISSTATSTGTADTGISRSSAGVIAVGNGAAADTTGSILAGNARIIGSGITGIGAIVAALVSGGTTATTGGIQVYKGLSGVNATELLRADATNGNVMVSILQLPSLTSGIFNAPDTGLSRIAAGTVGVGNGAQGDFSGTVKATIINAVTGFQVNGVSLAASNLSNGVTGTGAIVLATSPSLTTPSLGAATATGLTGLTSAITPNAAAGTTIGSLALPFSNIYVRTLGTNAVNINTATLSGNRNFTIPDSDCVAVIASTAPVHQFATSVSTGGIVGYNQPASTDLSDVASLVTATSSTVLSNKTFSSAVTPNTAGGVTAGSAALPFSSVYVGAAATNNIQITGTATAARTLTLPDANSVSVVASSAPAHQVANGISIAGAVVYTQLASTDLSDTASIVLLTSTQTLTNKRVTPRQVSMADATSVTPTSDTADINTFTSTQAGGTLTVNAPTGTPTDGQKLILRLKSTNAQTYSFNATYAFSTTVTAPTTLAAGKTDYIGCMWNATNTKWDVVAVDQGH